jgi:hypothetical protein
MDPTGHAKVTPDDISLPDYEINILSPIESTYRGDNLFYFPESYERLEEIVKTYPANKRTWVLSLPAIIAVPP